MGAGSHRAGNQALQLIGEGLLYWKSALRTCLYRIEVSVQQGQPEAVISPPPFLGGICEEKAEETKSIGTLC